MKKEPRKMICATCIHHKIHNGNPFAPDDKPMEYCDKLHWTDDPDPKGLDLEEGQNDPWADCQDYHLNNH